MTNSNVRCKRDYEDLDSVFYGSSSIESVGRNNSRIISASLGTQQFFCRSDSAINNITSGPSRHNEYLNPQLNNYLGASIPCFLRSSVNNLTKEQEQQFNDRNVKEKRNSNSFCVRRHENIWLISFICFYGLYLIIGSFIIEEIEQPIEKILRQNYTNQKNNIIQKYPQFSDDLEKLVKLVIAANDIGVNILDDFQNASSWTFGQSLFFSTSLVTTIGYGYVTPKSQLGKTFCIIFAAIGIPLTLVLLSAIVERLLTPTNYILRVLIKKFNYTQNILAIRLVHLLIIGFIVFTLFFVIPIYILLQFEEKWSILDAFYFCFISLTTIGLGDFVPGETPNNVYNSLCKVIFSVFMILGLIGMMLLLTVFYNIPQLNIGILFARQNVPDENQQEKILEEKPVIMEPGSLSLSS